MADSIHTILDYHTETSHARGQLQGRSMNPSEQPIPFKLYRGIPPFPLPQTFSWPEIPLDNAMAFRPQSHEQMDTLLAGVCNLATGITQAQRHTHGKFFHFRSMASAGALYPTELYVAIQNVTGLNDGLYHYSPLEHTLTHLRKGQVFSALAGAKPLIRFYLTTIFHRSAWKYGSRAYRYCLLDAGHVAENLVMACRMYGLPAHLDYDFDDTAVNAFLCVDPTQEGCLAQVHGLGCSAQTATYDSEQAESNNLARFSLCAPNAHIPPDLLEMHRLCSATGVIPSLDNTVHQDATPLPDPIVEGSASATVQRRRSKRNFIASPAPTRDLVDILGLLCQHNDARKAYSDSIQVGFLASKNSGLTPGYHHLNLPTRSTSLIKQGDLMTQSAHMCLDQNWLENAAMHIVFTANLGAPENTRFPRTYRYAHQEAGRLGQRIYLAATAKRLGACGIGAFFDTEATTLLSLPKGHALLYLVAVGPIKR